MPELSYVHGASEIPLIGEPIFQNLRRTAASFGDREALVAAHQDYRATYRELVEQCEEVARGLMARGVASGDRVGIWSPNRYEWVIVQYATAAMGAILVNINPAYRTSELEYALKQSGISFLILAAAFRQADYRAMLAEVKGRCPELREALVLEDGWDALRRDASRVKPDDLHELEATLQFDDPINIQYTSGTTGFPKGATLTHHNILNNGFFIGETLKYTERDRVCIPVPFYHCFGMVLGNLACTTHGATMVIPAEAFDPIATMQTVEQEHCTSLYGVPTMFIAELEHPRFKEFDFSSLRTGIMAGSPCPVEVMKKVQTVMHIPEMTIAYGMTETSPVSTQCTTDDPLERRVSTVGRVHPHVEIKIVDPTTGAVVPRGATGELCSRGYIVMRGYWNNEEATGQAIDAGRWMHTGDLATMDEDGYLNIVGRIKDMIIRGGENIYPREVEEFLYSHPDIADVQVIGVPSERYGEEVMAWVKLREGAAASPDELAAWCKGKIATYKIPRHWKFVDAFPMTVTGKVQKFKMRETAIEELGLEKAAGVRTA
ncbi:MAG: AMP-binding protein [Chloroflexi bacterium]|nr:MAG: AMP-binding protein [Chloroflexota bacterium]TME37444.1 MAG: AMP-binding protein [Chloroflexota bacterium]TME54640.1 MAG: AMP-binding protein [Chloroflexota bacterium]